MTIEEPKARKNRQRPPAPTTPDPVEIAMEAAASGQAPGEAALEVLRANAALIREQIGLARNERFRNRIKAVRDITLAVAVLLMLVGAIAFVWSARQASGLVIQPFSTPPDLAARGIDGKALASQLLDRLNQLQAGTYTARAADTYANNWEGDVSVEIPSTGVSIAELSRWLRAELGRETQITGEVVRDGDALIMTVRAGAVGGRATRVEDGDLDRLIQASAEAIYEQTQPYRYSQYVRRAGRIEESWRVSSRLAAAGAPTDRAWANNGQSIIRADFGDIGGAAVYARRALKLKPDLALGWNNLSRWQRALGDDEGSLASLRQGERHLSGPARSDYEANAAALLLLDGQAQIAEYLGDPAAAADFDARRADLTEYVGYVAVGPAARARHLALAHDTRGAWRVLAENRIAGAAEAQSLDHVLPTRFLAPTAVAHASVGNWDAAALDYEIIDAAAVNHGPGPFTQAARPVALWPYWAEALARSGKVVEAEALVLRTPMDCHPCLTARGIIAAIKGDPTASDRWFARAVLKAPSLPRAYSAWGEAKLRRGDRAGAIALFRLAHEKGPRWADPLKFWGDALAAQGDHRGAIRKYRAAADRAPNWGALHLAWGRALEAQGRRDQAREKYAEAARLDLSAADRAEVLRWLRTT